MEKVSLTAIPAKELPLDSTASSVLAWKKKARAMKGQNGAVIQEWIGASLQDAMEFGNCLLAKSHS